MEIIKCKMCGGELVFIEGTNTARCEFCDCVQTVPTLDNDKKLVQFERAERLRKQCEFDKAAGIYENIVAEFRQEAEAYWGLVLCKYGIEYVDDPATGRKVPTCHRSSFDSVMEDSDFEQAMENADEAARRVYRAEAKTIEEIRKGIIAVSGNEQPYDIFICYKETAPDGNRTLDSVIAQDVYDALTDKGYRVFFSRISLEDKLGTEYEPYIFAALNSAKVMLVFGTDFEYFNAVWVKNEWSRFLKLMAADKSKYLIPCYKDIDAYDMPKEFAKLQAQDMGKVGAVQDLLRGIEKLMPKTAPQAAVELTMAQQRRNNPAIIKNVCSIGTNSYDEFWPNGPCQTIFNYDDHNVVCFNLSVDPMKLYGRSSVKLQTIMYNERGNKVLDDVLVVDWASNYERLAKTYYIRGQDGSVVPTGRYHVEFYVDESAPYEYDFAVTSNAEMHRQMAAQAQQNFAMQQQAQQNYQQQQWMMMGRCRYCGGTFKGLFLKSCAYCGRHKDY